MNSENKYVEQSICIDYPSITRHVDDILEMIDEIKLLRKLVHTLRLQLINNNIKPVN